MARPQKPETERRAERTEILRRFAAWERSHSNPPSFRELGVMGHSRRCGLLDLRDEGWIEDLSDGWGISTRKYQLRRDHKMNTDVVAAYVPRGTWPLTPWVKAVSVDGGHLIFDVE